MNFRIGNHVYLDRKQLSYGVVSEVVPAHAVPRSVRHTAAWRRPVESYVVTVLTSRTLAVENHGHATVRTLSCRRVWPNPETLVLRERIR